MNEMIDPHRRAWILGGAAFAAGLSGASAPAFAQGGAVRIVLPNATGSGIDAIARAAQPALQKSLAAPVVIENQPGAGGIVGLQTLARAAPDGMTLAIVSNNVVIFPSVLKSLPFDMPNDFTPIALLGATPLVLVVNPNRVPATNRKELAALLKAKPGTYNYGSGGNGTILHLAMEIFLEAEGASGTAKHIPYKGVGPMVTDLMGGQIDFATIALPSVQGQIASGALRAVGVMSAQRSPAAPQVATIAEQGHPGFVVDGWFALVGPKNLSPAAVRKAHDAVASAFADAAVKEAMAKQGNTIAISTPEQANAEFRKELSRYAALVKKVGLEAQ